MHEPKQPNASTDSRARLQDLEKQSTVRVNATTQDLRLFYMLDMTTHRSTQLAMSLLLPSPEANMRYNSRAGGNSRSFRTLRSSYPRPGEIAFLWVLVDCRRWRHDGCKCHSRRTRCGVLALQLARVLDESPSSSSTSITLLADQQHHFS